ncbi:MAG: hypothetical protein M0Z61_07380 [Nitrospiraceae bacterium]|nr:hypothetical protein [Nitrospiraceae bacterium]
MRFFRVFVLAVAVLAPSFVFAQSQMLDQVSPSFIMRTQKGVERYTGKSVSLEENGTKSRKNPGGKSKANEGVSFLLKAVTFNHSDFLKKGQIEKIIKPFVGKEVCFADLQKIVNGINRLYRGKGVFTAVAIIPPQKIKNGTVRIELVEGKLGALTIKNSKYTRPGFIENRIPVKRGEVVDLGKLNREIVFLNRTTNLNVRADLEPGSSFGQTNLALSVKGPERVNIQFFADNYGSQSTGRDELGAYLGLNGLLGDDDTLSGYVIYGQDDNVYGSAAYSLILNRYDGRLNLSYSRNKINIIRGPYEQLGISGNSDSAALSFDQPLLATSSWKLDVVPSLSYTGSSTSSESFELSHVTDYAYSLGADLYWYFKRGMFLLNPAPQFINSHEEFGRNRGIFVFGNYLSGYYVFNRNWHATLNSAVQYAATEELAPSGLFQLGGISSLRAYEPGILSGDSGYYVQLELHRRLIGRTDAFVFGDGGGVWPNPNKEIADSGLGLDVAWSRFLLNLSAGYAFNKVTDDQDRFRVNFRLTWNIL